MDAQRTAEARIEQVERRLTALQEAGVDTAGLASRLEVARTALAQGRPEDVPAVCEDLLVEARRLVDGGATATRAPRPVRTDRLRAPAATDSVGPTPAPAIQSALAQRAAAPAPAAPDTQVLRDRLTTLLQPHLMAIEGRLEERLAGLAPLVESLKTQVAERPGLDLGALEQAIERSVAPLLDSLQAQVAERFARLSASDTAVIAKPGVDAAHLQEALGHLREEMTQRIEALGQALPRADAGDRLLEAVEQRMESALEEARTDMENRMAGLAAALPGPGTETRLTDLLDRRLEARLAAVTEHTAMAIEALRSEVTERPAITPATVRVQQALAQAMPEATAAAVDQAVAPLEHRLEKRLTTMAETVASIESRVGELASGIDHRIEEALGERLAAVIGDQMKALDATVADTVRTLLAEAGVGKPAVDTQELRSQIVTDLQVDLDFQLEQMAAQRGWVSINDVRAEVAHHRSSPGSAPVASAGGQGLVRLEAALVEFVRQTQSQQEQFLSVLQDRVVRSTEALAQRALTGAARKPVVPAATPSSEALAAPHHLDALDPLAAAGGSIPEQAGTHSTQLLESIARGKPLTFTEDHERQPSTEMVNDPDLPPGDVLDPLGDQGVPEPPPEDEGRPTARTMRATTERTPADDDEVVTTAVPVTAASQDDQPSEVMELDAIMAPAAPEDEVVTTTHPGGSADDDLPSEVLEMDPVTAPAEAILAEPAAVIEDLPAMAQEPVEDVAEALAHTMAAAEATAATVPAAADVLGDLPEATEAPVVAEAATVPDPTPAAADPVAEVMEVEAVAEPVPVPGAVMGLDDHETRSFDAVETQMHATEEAAQPEPPVLAAEEPLEVLGGPAPDVAAAEPITGADMSDAPAIAPSALTAQEPAQEPVQALARTQDQRKDQSHDQSQAPTTSRRSLGDLEAALRRVISQELERQLAAGLPSMDAAVQAAVSGAMALHRAQEAEHLEATIQEAVANALARQAPDPAKDIAALAEVVRAQAVRAPAASSGDLREAVMGLLQDPAIRQTVLEIVAVEAIANPGPLAELTGLRAFIRREVRQAGQGASDDLPSEVITGV